jgi:hypothetical protein
MQASRVYIHTYGCNQSLHWWPAKYKCINMHVPAVLINEEYQQIYVGDFDYDTAKEFTTCMIPKEEEGLRSSVEACFDDVWKV